MGLLSRLFGGALNKEMSGVRLEDREPWIIPTTREAATVLRSLHVLFPTNAFVYFEGTTEARFAAWLATHAVPAPMKIAFGTIWPKPDCYHVPLQADLLANAADLVDREGISLPSIHIHVHDGKRVLLEWHDAFCDDPMYVASEIPHNRVDEFARALGVGKVARGAAT